MHGNDHRRSAAGIWQAGQHELLGYDTDVDSGQQRGLQTLVLKTSHRSSYLRLHWDTIMGDTKEELARWTMP